MTEVEWQSCTDPVVMLESRVIPRRHAQKYDLGVSLRNVRLLDLAACRRLLPLVNVPEFEAFLAACEAAADEGRPREACEHDRQRALAVRPSRPIEECVQELLCSDTAILGGVLTGAGAAVVLAARPDLPRRGLFGAVGRTAWRELIAPERVLQAALIRCIFGNPYRPVIPDPAWFTPTVVALAAGVYADRAFDRLPVLADALDDAGCADEAMLAHCRGPGPHVMGCWALDACLGKS